VPLLERRGKPALRVEAGELISVLGAPGSGKTRLGLELAYLVAPRDGEVLFHGIKPVGRNRRRPKEITMLVQNAEDQLFAKNVFDDVAFGPSHLNLSQDEIEARVERALKAVRLDPDEVRERSPFALSGGERRRVALAGVLAMEPEVLILDEPTANLDPQTRNQFLDLLTPLRGKSAIVWMTSSAREAALASRIYLLRGGEAAEVQGGDNLLQDWRALAAAGIELPSLYALAGAMEHRGCLLPEAGTAAELRAAIIESARHHAHDR
jgi:energy-coupling factor transporter ATP-binding protein EcfA2